MMLPRLQLTATAWPGWLLLAIALRALVGALHLTLHEVNTIGSDFLIATDSYQYIALAENWRAGRGYVDALGHPAGRMPGYALPYLLLRVVFSQADAARGLIVLQVLLSGAAVWATADLARRLAGARAFYLAFVLLSALGMLAVWDVTLLTESLAISTLLVGLWLLVAAGTRRTLLLAAGALVAWSVFLRPAMLIPLAVLAPVLIHHTLLRGDRSLKLRAAARALLWVALPGLLAVGVWGVRNWALTGRLILSQSDVYAGDVPPPHRQQAIRLVQAWGGNWGWWEAHHAGRALLPGPLGYAGPEVLPHWALSGAYTADSLRCVQALMLQADTSPAAARSARQLLQRWHEHYLRTQPASAFVAAPLHRQVQLMQRPTFHLSRRSWTNDGALARAYKLSQGLLFGCISLGALLCFWTGPAVARGVAAAAAVYLIVAAQLLHTLEPRHAVPALPLLALATALWGLPARGIGVSSPRPAGRHLAAE